MGDDSNAITNYFDSTGYIYTQKKKTDSTTYFRCKNQIMYSCNAKILVRGQNFSQAIVNCGHNHPSEKKHLDRAIFSKTLQQICRSHTFFTPRACYQRAKILLKDKIVRRNIPSLKSFKSLIYRCQRVDIPLLPKTIDELGLYFFTK